MNRRLFLKIFLLGATVARYRAFAGTPVLLAAASDLRFALPPILEEFHEKSGIRIEATYGASGNLAQQILQGAPFEIFMSADEEYVHFLAQEGMTIGEGKYYALGRLALLLGDGVHFSLDEKLAGIRSAMEKGMLRHFAIANPATAPYGRAARETLMHLDLWAKIEPLLVYGENAAQAMQFISSGSVEAGLVPLSLVKALGFKEKDKFILMPGSLHKALRQKMVLTRRASEEAQSFYRYFLHPDILSKLKEYGFDAS